MKKPAEYSLEANVAPIRELAGQSSDYRALVCVFLHGANDSHNMLPPTSASANRQWYDQERGTLAVALGTELPLADGWGLHPSMPNMKTLFDAGRVGFLLNVGNMKEPTRRATRAATKAPDQLYSHNSQVQQWEGLPAFDTNLVVNGWMGRAGELAGPLYNPGSYGGYGACFSIAGKRAQMQGWETGSNDLNTSGAQTFTAGDARSVANFAAALTAARTTQSHENIGQRLMRSRVERAIANQAGIAAQLQTLGTTPQSRFTPLTGTAKTLGDQLAVIARIIQSRANFSHRRDLFYVSLGGWDDHQDLVLKYGPRLAALDQALYAFYQAVDDLQMENHVTTFTQSEFGRALKQNGTGSDHGWGGHAIVMGGAVNGGRMFGTAPNLQPGSEDDDGQGRLIPTTSVEQYVGTLLNWWGVPQAQLPLVFPNIARFNPTVLSGVVVPPASELAVAPAFSLTVMNKQLPAAITRTTSREMGHATMIDENGQMVCAAKNMLTNSAGTGGTVGVANALPTHWANASPNNGVAITLVDRGTDAQGEYVDLQWSGTNTSGAILYPHLNFISVHALRPPTTVGVAFQFSASVELRAGSLANVNTGYPGGAAVVGTQFVNAAGSYQADASGGPRVLYASDGRNNAKMLRVTGRSGATTSAYGNPQIAVVIGIGETVDFTLRIREPMFTYGIHFNSNLVQRPATYTRTVPNGNVTGIGSDQSIPPRWDHDPATRAFRGMLIESPAVTNALQNAIFNSAALGTPGTLPTGATAGSSAAGLNYSIVGLGLEDGLPYLEFRVFGTATGAGEFSFLPYNAITAVVAGANEDWTSTTYCRIVGGSTANISAFTWEVMGRVAGAANQPQTVSLLTATSKPLLQQRFQASARMGATIDGVDARYRLAPTVGQPVDITFRVGGPQLEKRAYPSTFKPSAPGWALAQPTETYTVEGTNFSSWYNSAQGSFVVKSAVGVGPATVQQQYLQTMSVSVGTDNTNSYRLYSVGGQLTGVDGTGQGGSRADVAGVSQGDVTVGGTFKVPAGALGVRAGRYAVNNANFAQRGSVGVADTTFAMPAGINRLTLAAPADGGNNGGQWFQALDYYNVALSDVDLAYVSANG